jgi:muconate cycloisomerase
MKITGVELFHISIPFAKPYHLSKIYGTLYDAHAVIIKIHTDVGVIGLGEADPMVPFTKESPDDVMKVMHETIAPYLIGQDPARIAMLEADLDRSVEGHLTARGAVNMALYDIIAKAKDIPAYTLLGGLRHAQVPLLFGVSSGTPDQDIPIIEEQLDLGCRCFMLKMGTLPIAEEIKRVVAVRNRFGDKIKIIVDANQGWELVEALEFVDGICDCQPDLIEQPTGRKQIDCLKQIRDRSTCALSADESVESISDAATLIKELAVDVFSIKVSKNGGLDKSKQIAQMADGFGLKCLMNSMLEFGISQAASLQLGCTLPNLADLGHAYGSVLRMSDDITDFAKNISRSVVTVPSEPGLGVALNEDKLKTYTKDYLKIE